MGYAIAFLILFPVIIQALRGAAAAKEELEQ